MMVVIITNCTYRLGATTIIIRVVIINIRVVGHFISGQLTRNERNSHNEFTHMGTVMHSPSCT